MRNIKQKLNSQRGASITWALLIFLVCSVIGSAVLVAGTVASGQMAKAAESDQRYYAVNSAARMLIDMVDDKPVVIVKEGSAYKDGETNTTLNELTVFDSMTKEAAYYLATTNAGRSSYQFNIADSAIDQLAVTVNEVLNSDGSMEFTIVGNGGAGNNYSLKIYFSVDKDENTTVTSNGETETTTTTYQYTWHIRDIEILGSKRWSS